MLPTVRALLACTRRPLGTPSSAAPPCCVARQRRRPPRPTAAAGAAAVTTARQLASPDPPDFPAARPLTAARPHPAAQNFFNAAGPSGMADPMMMQQGFRGGLPPMGGLPGGLPGGFGAAPTANLFSSIPGLNDAAMMGAVAPTTTAGPNSGMEPDSGDSSGGGAGGSGRGKKSAEQRAAAVQEKNRRAQKRFRERQVRGVGRGAGYLKSAACLPARSWPAAPARCRAIQPAAVPAVHACPCLPAAPFPHSRLLLSLPPQARHALLTRAAAVPASAPALHRKPR